MHDVQSPEEKAWRVIAADLEKRFGVTANDLRSKRRTTEIARVRAVAIALAYDMIRTTTQRGIAAMFNRSVAVVNYSIAMVNADKVLLKLHHEIKRGIEHDDAFRPVR